jgi:putative restriction endonuclease
MPQVRRWSRDELLVAMNLYYRLPFGRLHYWGSPMVSAAEAPGRTPSSVSIRPWGLAPLDPHTSRVGSRGWNSKRVPRLCL